MEGATMKKRYPMHPLMMLYFLVCVLAMIWPGATLANRIDPMIIGLPFFMFWYLAWLVVLFIGLIICYNTEEDDV
jgi:hypothetical protein